MHVTSLDIPGLLVFEPRRHADERGFVSEVWRADVFRAHAGDVDLVQDNHAYSSRRGTLRGLHFQKPPMAQGKLVRAVRGSILDVAVDIRHGSPTFGRHVAVELSAENWRQLWVPAGFLHGFVTLADETEIVYKMSSHYSPADSGGVVFDDPDLGIDWTVAAERITLSDRDRVLPRLRDLPPLFAYDGQG